jgi:hypothetical protein
MDLDYLLREWERFVGDVETGRDDYTIYEYLNDTTIREILEDLAEDAPRSLQRKLVERLVTLDQRYIAATDLEPEPQRWSRRRAFSWYREPHWHLRF